MSWQIMKSKQKAVGNWSSVLVKWVDLKDDNLGMKIKWIP